MGGPISVAMAGIYMAKLEKDVLKPPLPIFYRRYVDDTYVRRKKDLPDKLFEDLNKYHENIKFTMETNPNKFLDTKISYNGNRMVTNVVSKENKLPPHWSSNIPKRYKRNIINGELHRAKKISTKFEKELFRIRIKFKNAGYPIRFINSVISSFNTPNERVWNRDNNQQRVLINLPFCTQNEIFAKSFIKRLNIFTHNKYDFIIIWKTRKLRSLFPLKDRVNPNYVSDVIYEGTCTCNESYIGETDRNVIVRWNEHGNISKISEPSKHLKLQQTHEFNWSVICKAPRDKYKRRILETFFIKIKNPTLNKNIENFQLKLFQNGIT